MTSRSDRSSVVARRHVAYAELGINDIIPSPGLCRVVFDEWHDYGGSRVKGAILLGIIRGSVERLEPHRRVGIVSMAVLWKWFLPMLFL